jgi:hypothetical protein
LVLSILNAPPTGAVAGLPIVGGLLGLTSGLPLVGGGGAGASSLGALGSSLSLEMWLVTFQSSVVELALPLSVLLEAHL